jgi:hypothetical protein
VGLDLGGLGGRQALCDFGGHAEGGERLDGGAARVEHAEQQVLGAGA